ncbi:MAG: class I SAM-dependent methyltransferase family protein [Euryarchaeota archaeon]|nr:class I SAM-dependent methyltransferase family protein [Euryarchaeota archaeon]MBV1729630.1 class I SAM-dependent methyltransferase family protein [Methanobacterium sp.]MBU4547887.1 class I SAM-dependent methyltransferase family protein [Euryarchaeota archaeon]MBU4608897.1 class I SAM-dependent methyltransferase family protein [Euryarchaeota archaeon]MBV1755504.1 class I SAM-dependent methyltransferase family protein [Methanobacterium sp.]
MKWKQIGHVVVVNEDLDDVSNFLKIPGVNTVVKVGNINGKTRKPDVKLLHGNQTETIHKENKCFFKLDVSRVMWSKGNTVERMRIARLVEEGEIVVDMFAGIGYFSVPVAVHSNLKKLYSIEINPEAFYYLNENIILNKIESKVETFLGDSMDMAPYLSADRVLMGYIGNTQDYLKPAMDCVKGGGVIHYHETVPEKIMSKRPIERIEKAAGERNVGIIRQRIIKKYSPGVVHVVVDAKIE